MAQKESPTKSRQNPFTLLAVTALATSNLMVGVLQGNTLLILASSILSAGFACVYSVRSGMVSAWRTPAKTDDEVNLGSDGAAILRAQTAISAVALSGADLCPDASYLAVSANDRTIIARIRDLVFQFKIEFTVFWLIFRQGRLHDQKTRSKC